MPIGSVIGQDRNDQRIVRTTHLAPADCTARRVETVVRAARKTPWKIPLRLNGAARGCGLLRDFVLCDDAFEPRDILQQALAGQDQKVIAEFRILKVDLEQLFVGYDQYLTVLCAFDRPGPPFIGRKEAKFAHEMSRRMFDADFGDQEFSGDRQEHFVSFIVLSEQYIALAIFARCHKRLEPLHRHIALRRNACLLDEREHLTETNSIDWKHQEIQKKRLDVPGERTR